MDLLPWTQTQGIVDEPLNWVRHQRIMLIEVT